MPKSGTAALIVAALVMSGGFTQAAFAATAAPDTTTQQPVTADTTGPSQDPAPATTEESSPSQDSSAADTEKTEAPAPTTTKTDDPAPAKSPEPVPSAKPDDSANTPVPAEQPVPTVAARVATDTAPAPPESSKKPRFHPVLWLVPGGQNSPWNPNQTIADDVITDTASLGLLDDSAALQCGSYYQVDLYLNNKVTDSLVAGGVLYGTNNPKEALAFGALPGKANPWKFITTPACPPPVHTEVTPTFSTTNFMCNTETYKVEGSNTLTLMGQEGVVWTITKGSKSQTLEAGVGFTGTPPYGVGTYTITGADASADDLIDVTPVTTTVTFVSKGKVDCTPPPVVIAPTATIQHVCTADAPDVTYELIAGTNDATFQVLLNGDQTEEHTVKAGETFDGTITLGEDAFGGSATVEVKSGEASLTGVVTVSTDCAPPVTVIPMPPKPTVIPPTCYADGSLPTLVGGDGYTVSYDRVFDGPGLYRAIFASNPGVEFPHGSITVTYDLTVEGKLTGGTCPTSTPTPTPTPVPTPASTTPPTTLSSNGGANTGLYGDQPGSSSSWSAISTWTLWLSALVAFLLGAALTVALWYRRKRA